MIDLIIVEYLKNNKRLVIPELGTFIHKDGGETVFVEFMKKDDGILSALIAGRKGCSAEAAMTEIGRYAANVKSAVDGKGEYAIAGLGRIYKTPEGGLELDHAASGRPAAAPTPSPVGEKPAGTEPDPQPVKQAAAQQSPRQEAAPGPAKHEPIAPPAGQERSPRAERVSADKLFGTAPGENKGGAGAQSTDFSQSRTSDASSQRMDFSQTRHGVPVSEPAVERPRQEAAAMQNRQPGTPRPAPAQDAWQMSPKPRPSAPMPKQKKADKIMVIAIVAAAIALIALGFSVYVGSGPAKSLRPTNYIEQQTAAPAPGDAASPANENN